MFSEEHVLPRQARGIVSRLRRNGHSFLLNSSISRIGGVEDPSCSTCGHPTQDTSYLILHCPAMDTLHRSIVGDCLFLYDLWSSLRRVAQLLELHGFRPCPIIRKGPGNNYNKSNEAFTACDGYSKMFSNLSPNSELIKNYGAAKTKTTQII